MTAQTLIDTPLKVGDTEDIPEDLDATLRIVAGPDTGTIVPISDPITFIGRDEDCHLRVDDPRVSGRHAMVYFASGEFRVRDLESTNGSLLNGSPLSEFAFQDGDDLRVGKSVVRLVVDFRQP
jgi:pSer/pThr/pTyr-binding forkhead associated (FHA) protein